MLNMLPSFTLILSGLFTAYILHSVWTIYTLYNPPECDANNDLCLNPSWHESHVFKLFVCTSLDSHPLAAKLDCIYKNDNFLLSQEMTIPLQITLPSQTLNNGSLYLHAILTPLQTAEMGKSLITDKSTSMTTTSITKYALKEAQSYSLLSDSSEAKEKESKRNKLKSERPISHWKPKIVLNIVAKPLSLSRKALPGEIAHLLKLSPKKEYLPIPYISDVRQRLKELWPVNQSSTVMPVQFIYEPITVGKLRFMLIIESSLFSMKRLGFTDYDTDDVKGIFFDTNIYLLLITVLVTSFHVLFDFLAFKNDIQFWRHRKSMEGLSFSTLLWRCISQFVITLYLLDQKTSYLVLVPSAIGTVIEFWKLKKAMKIDFSGWRISMEKRTDAEKTTDNYDSTFMKYLSIFVLTPLVIGGAIYSILYTQHKSWYSWLIQSAANGVYAFGFLFMLPQLFINYKLKSVAHLPWRAFMYKAFNTFIDDLFAFLITSIPIAHRVAAFRDDVVFLIYLYQRWLYPVDKTRVNEFGEAKEKKTN